MALPSDSSPITPVTPPSAGAPTSANAVTSYLKIIGRGKQGAKDLTREQAATLMTEVLDGRVGDVALGAFCIAMRVKGETPLELMGFLDAVQARLAGVGTATGNVLPTIVIPSYNGARKRPLLTPLLALLLAREGFPVLIHGAQSERTRLTTVHVGQPLGILPSCDLSPIPPGQVRYLPLDVLHPGLHRLLMARHHIGLRNSAHSLVKLMSPVQGASFLVSSYTHPEYLHSMTETLGLMGQRAMLSRGTEGESVTDPKRMPRMDFFANGQCHTLQDALPGYAEDEVLAPATIEPEATADWIAQVLDGRIAVPAPIARQVELITQEARHGSY